MPQSRSRSKHHGYHPHRGFQQHSSASQAVPRKTSSTTPWFFSAFIGLMGALIGFFIYDTNWIGILSGLLIGGGIGYLIGNYINKVSKVR